MLWLKTLFFGAYSSTFTENECSNMETGITLMEKSVNNIISTNTIDLFLYAVALKTESNGNVITDNIFTDIIYDCIYDDGTCSDNLIEKNI